MSVPYSMSHPKAQIRRVRCWPLDSVSKPWEWYVPNPGGHFWSGSARTHEQAMREVQRALDLR